jgi:Mg-chelatase subunit ChlI
LLDELPEFGSRNLETLRQLLEDRIVIISRASGSLTFPANFVLVAALNPYSARGLTIGQSSLADRFAGLLPAAQTDRNSVRSVNRSARWPQGEERCPLGVGNAG